MTLTVWETKQNFIIRTEHCLLFSGESLYEVIVELFVAGSETTSITLKWCILYMQEYPEIQKRCQEEIAEVFYVFVVNVVFPSGFLTLFGRKINLVLPPNRGP